MLALTLTLTQISERSWLEDELTVTQPNHQVPLISAVICVQTEKLC